MNRPITAAVVSALLFAGCVASKPPSIDKSDLRRHVEFLASDDLAGRLVGTEGAALAENYIAEQLSSYGYSPLPGETDFFLEFDVLRYSFIPEQTFLAFGEIIYRAGNNIRPFNFSAEGEVQGKVIFAGYGITAPEKSYDDYADLDAEGKIVLVMRHEPNEDLESMSDHALFLSKAKNAVAHGAIGMLLYTDPRHHDRSEVLNQRPRYTSTSVSESKRQRPDPVAEGFLAAHISITVAKNILANADLSHIQGKVDGGTPPVELGLEIADRFTLSIYSGEEIVQARNVAAFKAGTAAGADEWIVVGAHHDHIGSYIGEGDTIFNGADDNASGVAGVLELAEQFSTTATERSLVFMTFAAEEVGLFGSRALETQKLIDLDKVVFMLNLDMIGRNPKAPVQIFGDGFTQGLSDIVTEANMEFPQPVQLMGTEYEPFSDMDVFHKKGIPFLMLFTGEHRDYHGVGDHANKLDYPRMTQLIGLSYDIVNLIAGINDRSDTLFHDKNQ